MAGVEFRVLFNRESMLISILELTRDDLDVSCWLSSLGLPMTCLFDVRVYGRLRKEEIIFLKVYMQIFYM